MSTEDALRTALSVAFFKAGRNPCHPGNCTHVFCECEADANTALAALPPLPVLSWCSANPEAAKGLAEGTRVAVPRSHLDGLQRHYRENPPLRAKEPVDVRDLVAALDLPYVPAVIDYEASGESEFVLLDTLTIAHDGPGYVILKDETGAVIGFRWRTVSPPAPSDKAQGESNG